MSGDKGNGKSTGPQKDDEGTWIAPPPPPAPKEDGNGNGKDNGGGKK